MFSIAKYYKYRIFPKIMDRGVRIPEVFLLREQLLANVYGKILEIGYGTGSSLRFYPSQVKDITAIEPNEGMKLFETGPKNIHVDLYEMSVEKLNFPDNAFDCVVSMFTLCSVKDLDKALKEIKRVLKKDGILLFLEHGKDKKTKIAFFQKMYNPVQKILADGCRLTVNFHESIIKAGFRIEDYRNIKMRKVPWLFNYFYFGKAYKI